MPGDTILVKPGVYRERISPPRGGEPSKPIIYRGEKLGSVFVKGSNLWSPDWKQHKATVYYAAPDESLFDYRVYLDSGNPFSVELASNPYGRNGKQEKQRFDYGDPDLVYTCGQVIVNGKLLTQAPFLSEVQAQTGTSKYDSGTGQIYINFGDLNPAKQTVEITTRRRIFAPHIMGLGHIVVEGFVFEHCGNQYPTNFWNTPVWGQAGAIGLRAGHHWVIRNNVIRYANTVAIDIGASGGNNEKNRKTGPSASLAGQDNLIERNYIVDNVVHYCVANMPGAVGRTSTQALCNATLPYARKLAALGVDDFAALDAGHGLAVNIRDGRITNDAVAEAFPDLPS